MKRITLPLLLGGCAMSIMLLSHCTSNEGPVAMNKATDPDTPNSSDSLCLADPSWFPHSQTPAPEEGKGSPFDVASTTNQIFHQWSWNKFLWLTKPDAGGNPLFLNADKVKQVTTYMDVVKAPAGTLVKLQDFNQAGHANPMLQTNPDYNGGKSETVYYSIHMNDIMFDASVGFADALESGKLKPVNDAMFPVGSFELKVAWVPVDAIPAAKQKNYYSAMASLSRDGGKTYANTMMALIGMHVVGVVENHPEFIWATFEHDDIAPNYDWKANSASAAEDKLLFKKGSVTGISGIQFNTTTKLGETPYQVFDLFQYGIPLNPDGTYMSTSQQEPADFQNVQGINNCVRTHLDDVWQHYFYNGSIWLDMDGKTPQQQAQLISSLSFAGTLFSGTPGSPVRGSVNCANVTMESFTQTFQKDKKDINVNNIINCFYCHTGSTFSNDSITSPIYLSHTFQDYYINRKGTPRAVIEKLKTQSEKRLFLEIR